MFTRAAKYMRKVISYPSNFLSALSMVAMVFIMATVVVSVTARFVFDSPVRGAWDLVTVCFSVMVWGPMAMAALKGSHTALTFVLDKFPRLPRSIMQLIISLGTSGILGIVTWRLVAYGIGRFELFPCG